MKASTWPALRGTSSDVDVQRQPLGAVSTRHPSEALTAPRPQDRALRPVTALVAPACHKMASGTNIRV